MRSALLFAVVLATAAPHGCQPEGAAGTSAITDPWEAACVGKGCGDPCVIDPPCLPAGCLAPSRLGRCDPSGQCVPLPDPVACVGDPACAGKACGATCDPCGGLCMHPYASGCDFAGRCVPVGPYLCYDPCAGSGCGVTCHLCPPGVADCVEPAVVLACDRTGLCQPAPATCP